MENKYFLGDGETIAPPELVRLRVQDEHVTSLLPLIPPACAPLNDRSRVLDLACGPGGWPIEIAIRYQSQVLGGDTNTEMITYARERASLLKCSQAHFEVADITNADFFEHFLQPYHLIHLRFAGGFLLKDQWPLLLHRCHTATEVGGWIYLGEWGAWKFPPALDRVGRTIARALFQAGMNFSPDTYAYGSNIAAFLENAGYQHVEKITHRLEYKLGTTPYADFEKNMRLGIYTVRNFIQKMHMMPPEDFTKLSEEALLELADPGMTIVNTVDTVWGQKQ